MRNKCCVFSCALASMCVPFLPQCRVVAQTVQKPGDYCQTGAARARFFAAGEESSWGSSFGGIPSISAFSLLRCSLLRIILF